MTRAQLNSVICQRVDPMIAVIGKALSDLGFSAPGKHHVVLTGGGAELKGLADQMQAALGRTVRVGRRQGLRRCQKRIAAPPFQLSPD